MYDNRVRPERTGWRDEAISRRHREWGYDCPAVDLDLVMVEYNRGLPTALVEYKAVGAQQPNFTTPTYRALSALANVARIPFFLSFYKNSPWCFKLTPVNGFAKTRLSRIAIMSELEYVTFLYELRGLQLPSDLARQLNTYKP